DMLDDSEAEAGAAGFAAARRIDPVEALGHPRQMLARNAGAIIGDGKQDPRAGPLGGDVDRRAGLVAAVTHRIADEIVEHLDELGAVAADRREFIREFDPETTVA